VEIGALIVDDEDDVRRLIRIIIEANRGLFVSGEAANGHEALDQLDQCNPHVVVLDQMMPGMTGLETAELIRARRPRQPMILCTANLDADLRDQAEAAGIKISLSKDHFNEIPAAIRAARGLRSAA
jgi:DNA-binding NarL/FixJ family response regulator